MTPQRPERRLLALVLAFVAIACLIFAGLSKRWLYSPGRSPGFWSSEQRELAAPPYELGFGLRETFACMSRGLYESSALLYGNQAGGRCVDRTNAEVFAEDARSGGRLMSAAFVAFGLITFAACVAAALLLLVAASLVVARKRVITFLMPTTASLIALLVALVSGGLFLAVRPGPPGYVGLGLGTIVFGVGAVTGIASSVVLGRLLRPVR
jgi:hypothetical protein